MNKRILDPETGSYAEAVSDLWGVSFTEVVQALNTSNARTGQASDTAEDDPTQEQTVIAALKGIQTQNIAILALLMSIDTRLNATLSVSIST